MNKINCDSSGNILVEYGDYIPILMENHGAIEIVTNEFSYNETITKHKGLFGKTYTSSQFEDMYRFHDTDKAVKFCKKYNLPYSFEKVVLSERQDKGRSSTIDHTIYRICRYNMIIKIPDTTKLLNQIGFTQERMKSIAETSYVNMFIDKVSTYLEIGIEDAATNNRNILSIRINPSGSSGMNVSIYSLRYHSYEQSYADSGFVEPNKEERIMLVWVIKNKIEDLIKKNPSCVAVDSKLYRDEEGIRASMEVKIQPKQSNLKRW